MVNFICQDCEYRLESEADCTRKSCPYCGKFAVIREPTAGEIVDDCSDE